MAEITRTQLRRKLKRAGLPTATCRDSADGFHLIEFVDYWGIQPSHHEFGATPSLIKQALDHLGLYWTEGNMILVYKDQPERQSEPTEPSPEQQAFFA